MPACLSKLRCLVGLHTASFTENRKEDARESGESIKWRRREDTTCDLTLSREEGRSREHFNSKKQRQHHP